MKIGVIGVGYVGLITGVCLSYVGHNVVCYDVDEKKIKKLNEGQPPIFEKGLFEMMKSVKNRIIYTSSKKILFRDVDVIILAVGTPEDINGLPNLSYIYQACDDISKNISNNCIVAIKSTVPVGTSEYIENYFKINTKYKVGVISNPEFLAQGSAINDTLHADRIVVGCNNAEDSEIMKKVYMPLLGSPYNVPFVVTDRKSAEMIKYASNNFLALKLSYINELANLCKKCGADISEVTKCMGLDKRIGNEYMKPGLGFGGSCLPKDTKALYQKSKLKLVKATIDVNDRQNLILFKELMDDFDSNIVQKKIAVLGLTFKPGTDDVREAPSIKNVKLLVENGAVVKAFDPIGVENFKKIIGESYDITYYDSIEKTITGCEAVMIMTDWQEILDMDINLFTKLMKVPRIYDGRNCFKLNSIEKYKVYYLSIGRKTINNI